MLVSEFPFYALSNEELLKETGAWVHDSANSLVESRDFFKDNPISKPFLKQKYLIIIHLMYPFHAIHFGEL